MGIQEAQMTLARKQFVFSDYAFLRSLKSLPTGRLCELAILRELSSLGRPLPKPYLRDEHELLWRETCAVFASRGETGTLMDYIWDFVKQLSVQDNDRPLTQSNHISHYVKLAVEIAEVLHTPANIIELGANHGLLSYTLSLMGNTVLCTDIHYGMLDPSAIESYKMGTWFREHFIGLASVDSFTYSTNNTEYMNIFEDGLDAIVWRGVALLGFAPPPQYYLVNEARYQKLLIKYFNKRPKYKTEYEIVLYNCLSLMQGLNPGGILYAAQEPLFAGIPQEEKALVMQCLVKDISTFGFQANYHISEPYTNDGWGQYVVTLWCKK